MSDLFFLGYIYKRQAEIHDRLGHPQKAARYYQHLIELWKDADPELQEHTAYAQQRLNTLAVEEPNTTVQ